MDNNTTFRKAAYHGDQIALAWLRKNTPAQSVDFLDATEPRNVWSMTLSIEDVQFLLSRLKNDRRSKEFGRQRPLHEFYHLMQEFVTQYPSYSKELMDIVHAHFAIDASHRTCFYLSQLYHTWSSGNEAKSEKLLDLILSLDLTSDNMVSLANWAAEHNQWQTMLRLESMNIRGDRYGILDALYNGHLAMVLYLEKAWNLPLDYKKCLGRFGWNLFFTPLNFDKHDQYCHAKDATSHDGCFINVMQWIVSQTTNWKERTETLEMLSEHARFQNQTTLQNWCDSRLSRFLCYARLLPFLK